MAGLTNNGTQLLINDNKVPSGYTKPTVTTFTDYESTYKSYVHTMAKSTVEAATESATMDAIIAAVTAAVTALITADYHIDTLTVTVYADIIDIASNEKNGDNLYKNGATDYDCTVNIFVKTAA